jgi:IS30 family transposase
MKQRRRIYYNAQQRTLIWSRYQQGESLHDIAKFFGRGHSSIQGILIKTGGFKPPAKKRAPASLTAQEREEISRGISSQLSIREIAKQLNRAPSKTSREVNRNVSRMIYRANKADIAAWERAKRPKPCKFILNKTWAKLIAMKLHRSWLPQQIAGWLMRTYPNKDLHVFHETIYKTLYIQTRGALKKELQQCLRSQRVMRRSKHATLKGKGLGKTVDAVHISERPPEVADRPVPGHWEGDLIASSGNSYIATLVERHSRYVVLVKVASNKTAAVISALINQSKNYPTNYIKR